MIVELIQTGISFAWIRYDFHMIEILILIGVDLWDKIPSEIIMRFSVLNDPRPKQDRRTNAVPPCRGPVTAQGPDFVDTPSAAPTRLAPP